MSAATLARFEESVRYHFSTPPTGWTVEKRDARRWVTVNQFGDTVNTYTTKRAALEDLTTSPYVRIWRERDEWYRGTSTDPRNRPFTADEAAVIASVLATI